MMDSSEVPSAACPFCSHVMDHATAVQGDRATPKTGDITVCTRCAGVLEFDDQMQLIHLRDETLRGLDAETWELVMRAKFLILAVIAKRGAS